MAPSDKAILGALRSTVQKFFRGADRNELTVNNVRSQVETSLQLDPGFLKTGSWKQKSKELVTTEYDQLLKLEEAGVDPTSNQSTPAKIKIPDAKKSKPEAVGKPVKRALDGGKVQPRKRQKKQETPESSELASDELLEDSEEDYVNDVPKTTSESLKSAPKQKQKKTTDHQRVNDNGAEKGPKGSTKVTGSNVKKKLASKVDSGDDDSDLSEIEGLRLDQNKKRVNEADGSDSDMSVLIDEPPKRKKKTQSATSAAKSSKPSKTLKPSVNLSPDEAEIKMLQTQLTKCGIRKIWGVILKPYGTDSKAKIRHLKGMLEDAGMEGRFSEAKAKEIKEARELMADLEAVREGEASWGMGRESRTKKTREKKKIVDDNSAHELDGEMGARSRSASEKAQSRIAKAKLDLAFLGDEESDSDD